MLIVTFVAITAGCIILYIAIRERYPGNDPMLFYRDGSRFVYTSTADFEGEELEILTISKTSKIKSVSWGTLLRIEWETQIHRNGQLLSRRQFEDRPPVAYVVRNSRGTWFTNDVGDSGASGMIQSGRLKVGKSWSFQQSPNVAKVKLTVEAEEDITVPAGTFHVFRVVGKSEELEMGIEWIAPELGTIKRQTGPPDHPHITVLKEYSAGS